MKLKMKSYQDEKDYWHLRGFLRETFFLNDRKTHNWHVAQLDYWRWHVLLNCREITSLEDLIYFWETNSQKTAAVFIIESPGEVCIQVHPDFRSKDFENEMIYVAEENFKIENEKGQKEVCIWANTKDSLRCNLLKSHGFEPAKWIESQWRVDLDCQISPMKVPDGYKIRSLGNGDEIPARSWASWRGFHPDSPDEEYQGWEWYLNVQRCPLYHRDLDIVAVTPENEIASFSTHWYDDVTRSAYIEPVATVPEHQRKGLARATITEGLIRLQKMGCTRVFVSGFEEGANALYASALSPQHEKRQPWVKKW